MMSKFPIIEWKNIDGMNTPFTYPQHEKADGSFVITGENNPLPVVNYVMKNGVYVPVGEGNRFPINKSQVDWYASDSFSIIVNAGSTLFFRNDDFLSNADSFEDMTRYSHFYAGVQAETDHEFELLIRTKATGNKGSIVEDFKGEKNNNFSVITKTELTFHNLRDGIRLINRSSESQRYSLALGFWTL